MLGIGLGELVLAILLFCLAGWLIYTFAREPFRTPGMWLLGVFAVIYVLERLHIFALLQRIAI